MTTEDTSKTECIWLEIANVRNSTSNGVEIQVKGDRTEREPVWWKVSKEAYTEPQDDSAKLYRTLSEGLDKKRIVLAGLAPVKDKTVYVIQCTAIRIQYADSTSR